MGVEVCNLNSVVRRGVTETVSLVSLVRAGEGLTEAAAVKAE